MFQGQWVGESGIWTCSDPAWLLTYWALLLGSLCVHLPLALSWLPAGSPRDQSGLRVFLCLTPLFSFCCIQVLNYTGPPPHSPSPKLTSVSPTSLSHFPLGLWKNRSVTTHCSLNFLLVFIVFFLFTQIILS